MTRRVQNGDASSDAKRPLPLSECDAWGILRLMTGEEKRLSSHDLRTLGREADREARCAGLRREDDEELVPRDVTPREHVCVHPWRRGCRSAPEADVSSTAARTHSSRVPA